MATATKAKATTKKSPIAELKADLAKLKGSKPEPAEKAKGPKKSKSQPVAVTEERPDGAPVADQIDQAAKKAGKKIREIQATKNMAGLQAKKPMTADEARACVDAIGRAVDNIRGLVFELYEREGWRALGYDSWRACVIEEFSRSKSALYRELTAAKIELAITADPASVGELPVRTITPLARLKEPAEQKAAYEDAVSHGGKNGRKVPTERDVTDAVDRKIREKDAQIDTCLKAALFRRAGAEARWKERAKSGMGDAALAAAVCEEFGQAYDSKTPAPGYSVGGGKAPRFWLGEGDGPATLKGTELLDRVRELLGIFRLAGEQSVVNGKFTSDPQDIAKKRAAGKIPADAVVEVIEPEGQQEPKQVEATVSEPDDGAWLESLPLRKQLSPTRRVGFDRDAILFRRTEGSVRALRASHATDIKKAGSGSYSYLLKRFLRIEHPKHWTLCPTHELGGCNGTGELQLMGACPKCHGHGYLVPTRTS